MFTHDKVYQPVSMSMKRSWQLTLPPPARSQVHRLCIITVVSQSCITAMRTVRVNYVYVSVNTQYTALYIRRNAN